MSKLQDLSGRAQQLHQSGRIPEAIDLYVKMLRMQPRNAQLLFVLGTAYLQIGQAKKGAEQLQRSVLIDPKNAAAHCNLGVALTDLKRLEEALASCGRALLIKPDYPEAHNNRGNALRGLNRQEEALASYEQALRIKPDYAEAHSNRGNALRELERPEEALASYDQALAIRPDLVETHNNRGNALRTLKRLEEALESYDRALRVRPDYAEAHYNRGVVLDDMKRLEEALASYDQALRLRPDYAEAYNNRGSALRGLKRLEEALASYDQALRIRPDYVDAHYSRGVVLNELMRLEEALASYERALAIDPDYVDAHWNKSLLLLLTGAFPEGWALYEWRLKKAGTERDYRSFAQPSWRGDVDIQGKRLLIQSEQGLGDVVQFCRYLPQVKALGAEILFEVQESLVSLIATLACPMTVVAKGAPLPAFDAYCPIMSLPHVFGTTVETIPAQTPYLFSDPDKVRQWKDRLGNKDRPRVGVTWSGSRTHENDKNRSVRLEDMLPLMSPSVQWHSLQKEYRQHDLEVLSRHPQIHQHQDALRDFTDTAALIECMDLVISVDTSVVHVAGAIGKPVWILLPYCPDYRWMSNRDDSPWYPTARLFRQPKLADWQSVIGQALTALNEWVEAKGTP